MPVRNAKARIEIDAEERRVVGADCLNKAVCSSMVLVLCRSLIPDPKSHAVRRLFGPNSALALSCGDRAKSVKATGC